MTPAREPAPSAHSRPTSIPVCTAGETVRGTPSSPETPTLSPAAVVVVVGAAAVVVAVVVVVVVFERNDRKDQSLGKENDGVFDGLEDTVDVIDDILAAAAVVLVVGGKHVSLQHATLFNEELQLTKSTRQTDRQIVSHNTWKWKVLVSTVMVKVESSSSSMPTTAPFRRTQPRRAPRIIFSFDCGNEGT
ncbi:hypothetical protein E2C01_042632 [Portunus trituberculatus]|uniref:Uncharacterized protein n=1 Tax=Portunus trituberculatus TaxID=210409 RepID=A0A5B7FTY1_PORTR|nr:hypothetical protein [Portunus trituberculatus]